MFPLHVFPTSGLDRSIHAPVFVGLLFATFFAETLGWPFVGLVVPGYLAAVMSAAPVTAATIAIEAVVTYVGARALGEWIPSTGAWSVFFGRERFFLIVATSVMVRLVSEGVVLPWLGARFEFTHAAELYSIGLVLVPLTANACWNIGFTRGATQAALLTGLTYLVVEHVLLRYTNLSLSRFEVTYENPALDFLSSAKPYVLLLTSTMLSARNNVEYGWDYNGILVPGLLAVAWYEPLTVVSTVVQALIVVALAKRVVKTRLFAGRVIEGPRRTLLVFAIGFALDMAFGYAAQYLFPGHQVAHLYGFGYILPTLVALKVWQKSPAAVLMPTLQMSIVGFVLGNALGFLLTLAMPVKRREESAPIASYDASSLAWEMTLQSAWPERASGAPQDGRVLEAIGAIAETEPDRRRYVAELRASELRLRVASVREGGKTHLCLRGPERASERWTRLPAICVADRGAGVVVVRASGGRAGWLASELGRLASARVIVAAPESANAEDLRAFARDLALRTSEPLIAELDVRGDDARLDAAQRVRDALGAEGVVLDSPRAIDAWTAMIDAPPIAHTDEPPLVLVSERLQEPGEAAHVDALRVFSASIATPILEGAPLDPIARFAAQHLGLALLEGTDRDRAVTIVAPAEDGGASFGWIAARDGASLAIKAVDERGRAFGLATALYDAMRPRHMVLTRVGERHATLGDRALELALGHDVPVLIVRPTHLEHANDVVLVRPALVLEHGAIPPFARDIGSALGAIGLVPRWDDGSAIAAALRGRNEPPFAYARQFHPDAVALGYVDWRSLARWRARPLRSLGERLERIDWPVVPGDLVDALANSAGRCDVEAIRLALARYETTDNPHALITARDLGARCEARVVRDRPSGLVYVVAGASAIALPVQAADVATVRNRDEARRAIAGRAAILKWVPE